MTKLTVPHRPVARPQSAHEPPVPFHVVLVVDGLHDLAPPLEQVLHERGDVQEDHYRDRHDDEHEDDRGEQYNFPGCFIN